MPTARIGDNELNYVEQGEGFAVVLIHGLAGDLTAWTPQLPQLAERYRAIAFDNRGAGLSTQRDEAVSTEDLARDTLGLMDALGVERAHVVGRSMGGAIAQHMALLAPARVHSLVLLASFARLDPVGRRVLANMREVLEWTGSWEAHARHSVQNFVSTRFFNEQAEAVARIEALIGGETRLPACYVRQNHACLEHDTLDRLDQIHCPTLICGGGRDLICSPTATQWLGAIPDSETVLFEDSSHFFLLEEPERFLATLEGWLARNTPA
ncbi:MAG: alpha/beta hydrolase [Candidatus Rokuibacteriota bacterium]|nr:MAG: alpha/beta hydrolase [Candidatus Rokubacteria bacterium]